MAATLLSDAQIAEAKARLEQGELRAQVARHFGVSPKTIMRWTDPEWREKRMEEDRRFRRREKQAAERAAIAPRDSEGNYRVPAAELARLRRSIPDDCRSLTARLMGDPIPNYHRREA